MKHLTHINWSPEFGDPNGTPPVPPADPNTPPNPDPNAGNVPNGSEGEEEDDESIFIKIAKEVGEVEEMDKLPQNQDGLVEFVRKQKEKAQKEVFKTLEEELPDIYKALVHVQNGGNISDLFVSEKTPVLAKPPVDNDVKSQKEIVSYDLKSKGLPDTYIDLIIANAIDKNELGKLAKETYESYVQSENKRKEDLIQAQKMAKEQQIQKDKEFITKMSEQIKKGKLGNFVIGDADVSKFNEFVTKSLGYDGQGGYAINLRVNETDSLNKTLQAMYFMFRGGDLSKYIDKKAQDEAFKKMFQTPPKPANKPANPAPGQRGFFPE